VFIFAELQYANWLTILLAPESNLINWLVLVTLLWWLGAKYLPPFLAAKRQAIESELMSASQAKAHAFKLLEEQKQKVANSEQEANRILKEAKETAEQMRLQIDEQARKDVEDLLKKFDAACVNERQLAVSQMRALAIRAAIKLTEENLRSSMNETARAKLLTQFVEQLDNVSGLPEVMRSKQLEVQRQ